MQHVQNFLCKEEEKARLRHLRLFCIILWTVLCLYIGWCSAVTYYRANTGTGSSELGEADRLNKELSEKAKSLSEAIRKPQEEIECTAKELNIIGSSIGSNTQEIHGVIQQLKSNRETIGELKLQADSFAEGFSDFSADCKRAEESLRKLQTYFSTASETKQSK